MVIHKVKFKPALHRLISAIIIVVGLVALFATGFNSASTLFATDNTTPYHWHAESADYKWEYGSHQSEFSEWEDAVDAATDEWTSDTIMDIAITAGVADIVVYLVEDFESPCSSELGCVDSWVSGNHLLLAEMFINYDKDWRDGVCGSSGGTYYKKLVALHEFGHAAGFLNDDTTDNQAVMYENYVHRCSLTSHDIDSMDAQYDGH